MNIRIFKISLIALLGFSVMQCQQGKSTYAPRLSIGSEGNLEEGSNNTEDGDTEEEGEEFTCLGDEACAMQDKVNEYRVSKSLSPLKFDPICSFVATEHAYDMVNNNYFSFINQQGQGALARYMGNPDTSKSGILRVEENIARGSDNIQAVFDAWLSSPTELKNLSDPDLTHHGVGTFSSGGDDLYWVHCFIEKQ